MRLNTTEYENLLSVDDRRHIGEIATPRELAIKMIDEFPEWVWVSKDTTFLDPCFGNGTFLIEIIKRLRSYGHSIKNIEGRVYGFEISHRLVNKVNWELRNYNFKNLKRQDFLTSNFQNLNFDVTVGSPPYKDGNRSGGQNKLYIEFCKQGIESLKPNGILSFITPISVLMPSKRFTLIGNRNLKHVDFNVNSFLKLGSSSCSWMLDTSYTQGEVQVRLGNRVNLVPYDRPIHNNLKVSKYYTDIYDTVMDKCKDHKDSSNRMFRRNNHGPAFSSHPTPEHIYNILSVARGVEKQTYTKNTPVFFKEKKVIIANTKALNENNLIVDTRDYGPSYFAIKVEEQSQVKNIKSFILSPFFVELYTRFRQIRGGINSVLIDYCPTFDINKEWSNEEVKTFFEQLSIEKKQ